MRLLSSTSSQSSPQVDSDDARPPPHTHLSLSLSLSLSLLPFPVSAQVWDLGGQATLRPSWVTYFKATDALVLVVDSTDRARIGQVKDELWRVVGSEDLKGAFVLVFANKQDLEDCMSPADISSSLKLHDIKDHDWHIQACSAKEGTGLVEGFDWMVQRVKNRASK